MYYKNEALKHTLNEILTSKAKITIKRALYNKFGVHFRYMNKLELEKIYNKIKYGVIKK